MPALEDYSGSTMGNLPLGQGLSVTPMQMMAGYAAIANGGILRPPRLIEEIGDEPVPEPRGAEVIDPDVAAQVREMLEGVLAPGGTASEVSVPGYTLAGKTGTAEVAENGTYSETKFVASFIGFAPAADPRLLVAVIVDQPQGDTTAAPWRRRRLARSRRLRCRISGCRRNRAEVGPGIGHPSPKVDGRRVSLPRRPSRSWGVGGRFGRGPLSLRGRGARRPSSLSLPISCCRSSRP